MAAVQPRSTRRAGRAVLVGVVALAHVAAFLTASLSLPKERPQPAEPPPQTFAVLPLAPSEPEPRVSPSAQPLTAREKREKEKEKKPVWAGAPVAPSAPAATPGWTLPGPAARGPAAGELSDPYAVREALRGSVGCDMENLKLRPDEQARCADRTARWAQKGRKLGPADDDPKRAAELAQEEDYQRRRHEWTTTNCGIGVGEDLKSVLGQMPPRRGQSKDGEDEERRNAC
jgi:type IV secretory pathway VirB10-like protein